MESWADKTHREPEPQPENRIRTHAWDAREIILPLQLCEPVTNLIARWCAFLSLPSLLSTFFASPRVENRRGG